MDGKPLFDELHRLAAVLPELKAWQDQGVVLRHKTERIMNRLWEVSNAEAGIDLLGALPSRPYWITVDGKRRPATAEQAETVRRRWRKHFLLDVPRRLLRVKDGRNVREVKLGGKGMHYGMQRILVFAMTHPGWPFGCETLFEHLSSDGHVKARVLSRYVFDVRKAVGDSGENSRYLLSTSVDRSCSDTGKGYVFDERFRYTVIDSSRENARADQ